VKVVLVLLIGALVGLGIELVLTRRQRTRRVVLDKPDGYQAPMAAETRVVVDEEGFKILGPVIFDDTPGIAGSVAGSGGVEPPETLSPDPDTDPDPESEADRD
jgi:hypothetical protein